MTLAPAPPDAIAPRLARLRGLARAVLVFERVWPAVAPALGVIGVAACAALLGLPALLSPTLHLAALAVTGLAVAAVLAIGLRRVVWPRAAEADRRLEVDSGLRHQPLAVLSDRPAGPASALWAAHVARARAQLARLRLSPPRPMLAAADPRALRALVLVALAISLGIAGPDAPARLARALHPAFPPPALPPAPLLQAWITPPSFTGLPPIFLKPDGEALTVPSGSRLQASLSGGTGTPALVLGGQSTGFTALDATSFQIDTTLTAPGAETRTRLAVTRRGREVAGWDVTLSVNVAPMLRFPEPPGVVPGPLPQTRLPWEASHAYGVASVRADLRLRDRPEAPTLSLPIPLPGGSTGAAPKAAHGVRVQDLTAHPWAGLPVSVQLAGRDIAGLEGRSEARTLTLPERRFTNPIARAIIELRKSLSRDPAARSPVIADLDRLGQIPQVWDSNHGGFLNLRAIASLLRIDPRPAAVDEAQGRMWQLAIALEEGAAERAERALEQARQALSDALKAEERGEKADPADLDRKTRELQEALRKALDALAEQARRDPTSDAYDPDAHPLDARDMQKLAQELRDAAKQGDTKTAQQKLAELEKMMEALKNARPEHGQMTEQEQKRAEKRQRGQQDMTAMQDIVKREGDVLDHAQLREQSRRRNDADTAQREDDRLRQQALRRAIGGLMQDYGDLTGDVPPELGEADSAMRDAAQALAEGRDPQAAQSAQRAIEALQKGAQQMAQQIARQFGRNPQPGDQSGDEGEDGQFGQDGQDGQGMGQGDQLGGDRPGDTPGMTPNGRGQGRQRSTRRGAEQRDPLGRTHGESVGGQQEGDDVAVPDTMEAARTRALQEELRRRGADRTRQQQELDYIDRLLRSF